MDTEGYASEVLIGLEQVYYESYIGLQPTQLPTSPTRHYDEEENGKSPISFFFCQNTLLSVQSMALLWFDLASLHIQYVVFVFCFPGECSVLP